MQILETDSKTQFTVVRGEWTVRVSDGVMTGLKDSLSKRAKNELVNLSILDWMARKDMSKLIGKIKHSLEECDMVKYFLFLSW